MKGLTEYFNPSLRTNFPVKEKTRYSFAVYCSCGFRMGYDETTDVFGCDKCGLRCTPQALVGLIRRRLK